MVPALWIIFSTALRNFANYHISSSYFDCINQSSINCSYNISYCSDVTNQTGCCFDDSSFKCVDKDLFLQNMDLATILIIICGVTVLFCGAGNSIIFRYVGSIQMLEIRKRLFSSILIQDMEWFDSIATEEISSRMTQ